MRVMLPDLPRSATWSICVLDADDGTVLASHEPDRQLRTASIGKIFLLLEAARQIAAGLLDENEPLTWNDDEYLADSGLWWRLHQRTLPLTDVCTLIGAVSDNLATNVLLRRVGLDAVTATTRALGFERSALLDRVREEREPHHPPTLSLGTSAELARLMGALHRDDLISADVCRRVREHLAMNTDLSMVAGAFGLDPLAHTDPDRGIRLINKTGTISTVRADVGSATGPAGSAAWAVLASWAETASDPAEDDPRDAVLATMASIGARIAAAIRPAPGSAAASADR